MIRIVLPRKDTSADRCLVDSKVRMFAARLDIVLDVTPAE
jgi:hypothetical protein